MKKRILLLTTAVLLAFVCVLGLTACNQETPSIDLSVPQLQLSDDLSISWDAVEGATGYIININGNDLLTTSKLSWPAMAAPGTYNIKIQPVAGQKKGEYSNEITYSVYQVTLPDSELFTVIGAQSVGQGLPYSFSISYAEGCEESTPIVKVNGQELKPDSNGKYTVAAADGDLDVSVDGVALNTYNVSLPSGTGYTVIGNKTALHGKDYTFRLSLGAMYTRSNPVVKVNGEVITGNNGAYTVENVTGDLAITVFGVTENTYTVTLPSGRGYTITPSGQQSVIHNGSISFTVTAKDPTYGITVKVNGNTLPGTNGKYTISNITQDYTVKVIVDGLPELTVVEKLLEAENWKASSYNGTDESLTLSSGSSLKASYLKALWEEGYTHLVFTVNASAAPDNNTNYTNSKEWQRYWSTITPNQNVDIRIDLNEFHDGNTWYGLNFNSGKMTVSAPRAYSSPETLDWEKSRTNIYFAIEDGYYVLETRANDDYVTSPTQWLKKYVVDDDVSQRSWLMYTDYLNQGTNTRSLLWGWGSPVNVICDDVNGGWSWNNNVQIDGYTDGEVFSLQLDHGGTTRFKLLDWVSNRNGWNDTLKIEPVDEQTILWSAADGYKLRLATTQDWIDSGITQVNLTLTGELNGSEIWYGNDDWSGGRMFKIGAEDMASGSYTVQYDLSLTEGKPFMLMASAGAIRDLQIKLEPVGETKPLNKYHVTLPETENVTVNGNTVAWEGKSYTFTVALSEGYDPAKLIVKVNGQIIAGEDGIYIVDTVTEDMVITVENVVFYSFAVHAPSGEGYTFQGDETALYGKDYTFRVIPKDNNNVTVEVNGKVVTGENNSYTVKNVKEDLTITVTCTAESTYVVTIPTGNRYTVTPSGNQIVDKGSSLSFTVVAKNPDAAVVVKANGKEITETDGLYTLNNISENIQITITANTVVDELLQESAWQTAAQEATEDSLKVSSNSSLKGTYLKKLWDAGYTHLVFTVNTEAAADDNTNFTHSDNWQRYWGMIAPNQNVDLRLDLNEFHDGNTWYNLNFNAGNMTVSNPRAYKSAETLGWTKSSTNSYFAVEDGYYVLETRSNGASVSSPTQWVEKYCIGNDVGQQTWFFYTDYITVGNNTRSILWGWGNAVNSIMLSTDGGWVTMNNMQTDGYTDGEVFSLHLDCSGVARFKISDTVTNRNNYAETYTYTQIDDSTYKFSTSVDGQKFHLASTSEAIAQGYTHLRVTLTGSLTGDAKLWYGNDDWSDGEYPVDASKFVNGQYTFDVKLDIMNGKSFTIMTNGVSESNPITDMQVKIEPIVKDPSVVTYNVTIPAEEGITFHGAECVDAGETYVFTVAPVNPEATVEVKVNGQVVTESDGIYMVENVTEDLIITVTVTEPAEPEPPEETNAADELLSAESWSNGGTVGDGTLIVPASSSLKADFMKALWNEGYTHLVFTVNAEAVDNMNYTHGGTWSRYWTNFDAAKDVDIRIDLNEFHDGDTWYNLNFNSGNMTVSNPRAYKSAETLGWTKSRTNIYFAIEDGYYVLETRANDDYVTSPTQWLKKYVVKDDAGQRSWLMYTDYISRRNNTRSMLWGWGSAVNTINGNVNGGWSWNNNVQTDGYTDGEVFSLHLDHSGTARFKILDWVSNRNDWNSALKLEPVDEQTIRWSAADGYKLRLATTQDLISAGYTTLRVTLTGDLGSALVWYGDDDWGDGEIGVPADKFVDGSYTFEVDLTAFTSEETFTLLANAATITDLLVKIEPVQGDNPAVIYNVTAPTGEGYTFTGAETVLEGTNYSFTVMPNDGVTVTVKVNGKVINGENGSYTVENVTSDLVITVETKVLTTVKKLLDAGSWSNGGTVGDGTLIVPAGSSLKADYMKALWNEGYTHLVFTVNAEAVDNMNYTHGGDWSRYWKNFDAAKDVDIRIDLNEFHDGDSWYNLDFNSGNMTVSNPRAYKSAETLGWTKSRTNIYFAIEDGYYVLETWANDDYVTSPTQWLKKYVVADDASQRSWLMYTDYITQGSNTRSMLWGWGNAVNVINNNVNGGWSWNNNVQTDGYADGEVFSLHLDHNGTARFKLLDWVSNRNGWNSALAISYVDAQTIRWSAADGYKLRLATTQELIADGYTTLKVTLTGDLGSAQIWYGDDDWGDGEIAVGADQFVDGSYTFTVDLTAFTSEETFTLLANAADITDLLVKIEPLTK